MGLVFLAFALLDYFLGTALNYGGSVVQGVGSQYVGAGTVAVPTRSYIMTFLFGFLSVGSFVACFLVFLIGGTRRPMRLGPQGRHAGRAVRRPSATRRFK